MLEKASFASIQSRSWKRSSLEIVQLKKSIVRSYGRLKEISIPRLFWIIGGMKNKRASFHTDRLTNFSIGQRVAPFEFFDAISPTNRFPPPGGGREEAEAKGRDASGTSWRAKWLGKSARSLAAPGRALRFGRDGEGSRTRTPSLLYAWQQANI